MWGSWESVSVTCVFFGSVPMPGLCDVFSTAKRRDLKGQFTPKWKIHILPVTCSAIYQSRLFWCELPNVRDISCRDVCLLWNIVELDGTQLVVLKVPKRYILQNSTAMSLSRNHDLVIQDNPHTLLWAPYHHAWTKGALIAIAVMLASTVVLGELTAFFSDTVWVLGETHCPFSSIMCPNTIWTWPDKDKITVTPKQTPLHWTSSVKVMNERAAMSSVFWQATSHSFSVQDTRTSVFCPKSVILILCLPATCNTWKCTFSCMSLGGRKHLTY